MYQLHLRVINFAPLLKLCSIEYYHLVLYNVLVLQLASEMVQNLLDLITTTLRTQINYQKFKLIIRAAPTINLSGLLGIQNQSAGAREL